MQSSHRTAPTGRHARGFSAVELVVTLAVMTLLVGVVSMRASGADGDEQGARIADSIGKLTRPVLLFHEDTGELPREYAGWDGASFHRLSMDPGTEGWDGPYLDEPLSRSWNPTGGQVHLFDYVVPEHTGGDGFDLDGDGRADVAGSRGAMMTFWNVGQDAARVVEEAFDADSAGADWMRSGRVEYLPERRRLSFLLLEI